MIAVLRRLFAVRRSPGGRAVEPRPRCERRLSSTDGRADAIFEWATQPHGGGCVCQPCLTTMETELMDTLREGRR